MLAAWHAVLLDGGCGALVAVLWFGLLMTCGVCSRLDGCAYVSSWSISWHMLHVTWMHLFISRRHFISRDTCAFDTSWKLSVRKGS